MSLEAYIFAVDNVSYVFLIFGVAQQAKTLVFRFLYNFFFFFCNNIGPVEGTSPKNDRLTRLSVSSISAPFCVAYSSNCVQRHFLFAESGQYTRTIE